MAQFSYEAVGLDGKTKKGNIEADSLEKARSLLRNDGLTVVKIGEASVLNRDINISIGRKKLKPRDLSVFCRQFLSILKAGVSMIAALDMLTDQTENKALREALKSVKDNVEKGDTLSDILNNDINVSSVLSIGELDTFRTLSRDREKLYKTFDQMMQDSVVSTVIEIYADEVCQYNEDGKIIWAESDDKDVSKYVNDLLEKLKIEDNCWDHIYQWVYLGDLYLETFDNLHPANLQ